MEVLPTPSACYDSVKRYWRRRKYRRVHGTHSNLRKKLKIVRLGGGYPNKTAEPQTTVSPVKVLTKFHQGYMGMVFGLFGGTRKAVRIRKGDHLVSVGSTGEEVDSRTVMEIYKTFAASRARESGCYLD